MSPDPASNTQNASMNLDDLAYRQSLPPGFYWVICDRERWEVAQKVGENTWDIVAHEGSPPDAFFTAVGSRCEPPVCQRCGRSPRWYDGEEYRCDACKKP